MKSPLAAAAAPAYNSGMPDPLDAPRADPFPTTHWSLVLQARDPASADAGAALAELCRAYWYPLYAFIRRRGESAAAAEDLTQGFFARLLEKDFLNGVERGRGRFRAFLLACCKHYLANERDRAATQKRGGGRQLQSLNLASAEGRYGQEPAGGLTAEALYERRWALTLLDQALEQLSREYESSGRAALFERLKDTLVGAEASYAEIGAALGLSEAAVKKAAQRFRDRYRAVLRERIAATVESDAEVEDEIRTLFAALRG